MVSAADTKFTVFRLLCVCTVTDFSAGALPIGVKFCMAVWAHLRQVFSYFSEDNPRDGWILGVNRDRMAGYASCWSTSCWCMCAVKV